MLKANSSVTYSILTCITIGLGLMSRTTYIPELIYPYLGDVLYALMFYWIFATLFPNIKVSHLFYLAVGSCFLIEISQLYQAEWINEIRHTRLGSLVLGFGFLWSDLVSYTLGGLLGLQIDKYLRLK